MKILVIDDEPRVAEVLAEALEMGGSEVRVAGSGEESLPIVETGWPDAVLLDIVMPGMSGIEILRRIRQLKPSLPVIIVSGRASDEQLDEAWRLGVIDVVNKPIGLNNLTEALSRIQSR